MVDLHCLTCGHEHEIYNGIILCRLCTCGFERFRNKEALVLTEHQKVLDKMDSVKNRVEYMLTNIPDLRNLVNKPFVFHYWHYNSNFCTGMTLTGKKYYELEDPENIRRAKQKLVEKDFDKFGPTDEKIDQVKAIKYGGMLDWVTQ